MLKNSYGFTLIELMIVIAIIWILTTMAMPSFQDQAIRAQVEEAFGLAEVAQKSVEDYYKAKKDFPKNNAMAGLPVPEKIIGNFVTAIKVSDGVINITLGNRVNKNVSGKIITVRPAIVKGEPVVPITWVYGYASVPGGMTVIGENTSDILPRHLPVNCRY
jgi:type IV pilus assembly protein PilA